MQAWTHGRSSTCGLVREGHGLKESLTMADQGEICSIHESSIIETNDSNEGSQLGPEEVFGGIGVGFSIALLYVPMTRGLCLQAHQ